MKKRPPPWHYFTMKTYPFDQDEINSLTISKLGGIHCVNLSQGLKQPVVYYQQNGDSKYLEAVKKALRDIKKYHGQPQGMFGGDEGLHGNNPVRGIEFCSISESMFSLETMLSITGDMEFADLLEKITYNALPTQASDDFNKRQYFQAANQIELSDQMSVSYQNVGHYGTDFVYGTLSGYPCCTTNMHQSWPKYVQNMWYATADGGVAALLYAPSSVELIVGDNSKVKITEETGYPFREEIHFKLNMDEQTQFPFHLRIPKWANNPTISVNGQEWQENTENQVAIIDRVWKDGDRVILTLPMELKASQWYDFAISLERGPLVYSLKVNKEVKTKDRGDKYREFEEVYAIDNWNYALFSKDLQNLKSSFKIEELDWDGGYPWNLENAPIQIRARGIQLPEWKNVNGLPTFPGWWGNHKGVAEEDINFKEIILVPYGCTTLRITEFPVYSIQ